MPKVATDRRKITCLSTPCVASSKGLDDVAAHSDSTESRSKFCLWPKHIHCSSSRAHTSPAALVYTHFSTAPAVLSSHWLRAHSHKDNLFGSKTWCESHSLEPNLKFPLLQDSRSTCCVCPLQFFFFLLLGCNLWRLQSSTGWNYLHPFKPHHGHTDLEMSAKECPRGGTFPSGPVPPV